MGQVIAFDRISRIPPVRFNVNRYLIFFTTILCVSFLLVRSTLGVQKDKAAPLVFGETFTIDSKIVNEARRINVYLPSGYVEAPNSRLPVLYMPDGGMAEDLLHVGGLLRVSTGNGTMLVFRQ